VRAGRARCAPSRKNRRSTPTSEGRAALRLAVIGDPVAHSASPELHRGFLRAAALDGTYEAIRVAAGEGARALDRLRAQGFAGINVTTPLKEEAFAYCSAHDDVARASGSVNTVVFVRDAARGHNTDGDGALGALRVALATDNVAGASILILGAGPTARAAALALRVAGARVSLWNRTLARAEAAAERARVALWRPGERVDAVLSALAPHADIADADLRAAILATLVVVDANYGPRATLAASLGRPVTDGRAMLEASARASFALFAR
jgi:shikimate dehydrogenase